jgi:hypothetical protein
VGYLGIRANKTNDNSHLGAVLPDRIPVSAFWRYRVSLQRKKCCQQIVGLNDESFRDVSISSRSPRQGGVALRRHSSFAAIRAADATCDRDLVKQALE